ncbi:MAG: hypothetical protein ACJ764_11225 [Solirubrobacteraceae bacterium]
MRRSALPLLTVALLTGCGGTPPSLADLRRDAGRICTRTNRAVAKVSPPSSSAPSTRFLTAGIARLEVELRQLSRLTPSSDVAPVYRAGLKALADELSALRAAARAIRRGEDPAIAFRTLQRRLAPLESQAANAWEALQIPACVSA